MSEHVAALDSLTQRPERGEQALARAVAYGQQGQSARSLAALLDAFDSGVDRQRLSALLISGALSGLDRAIAFDNSAADTRHLQYLRRSLAASSRPCARSKLTPLAAAETTTPQPSGARLKQANYLNSNGETLYNLGQFKLAAEYFQRALKLDPNNAWICQNLAEATARMPFKKGDNWEDTRFGHRLDETGKWDVAVRHYRRALKLDPATVERHRQAQRFAIEPASAEQIDNPIFIVGCGHSGTSLLLAILGNHPRIHPIPKESAIFLRTDAKIQATFRQWDADCRTQGKVRWAEKTPPHIFQIHRFLAFRPKARVILLLRDGRDVVCSLKFRQGYADLDDRLDRWIYDNLAGRPYWQHPQVNLIKYEDLVSQSESTLRSLCDFLGEDYDPAMLEYHKSEHRWYSDEIVKPEAIKTTKTTATGRSISRFLMGAGAGSRRCVRRTSCASKRPQHKRCWNSWVMSAIVTCDRR
ncbi:putative O-linked N-acetylglucosamine transferase, SPINDLY family [Thiorhodovibrio winogradskyi]|uniref:O-linked N-acetylglucosamine transferase, SPINDLY family n=1 Tax=Thiorhodovibrio winogradskyi TaxID=77007 RepID=A0ABZ0S4L7_9GAMM|nr:sulfotransferase [Thiorhodovibrio winogradskyi]